MRKLGVFIVTCLLFVTMVSCDDVLPGIGDEFGETENTYLECGMPYLTDSITSVETMPSDTELCILVDWSDFVRVGGVSYDGGFESRIVDESMIGDRIGEILYNVSSDYSSMEKLREDEGRDMTASFREVGCEIFAVKNDENSIAVLDDGKYYLYTQKSNSSIPFEVFGGEMYNLPGAKGRTGGRAINTPLQLSETFGCEEPMPQELSERYGGDRLNDTTLIIVELASSGGTEFGIESVSKSGDSIHVNVVQLDSDAGGDEAMHYWTFYIEIPKTDVGSVEVNVRTVEPLKTDSDLSKIAHSMMVNYVHYEEGVDYGRYEGRAVLNKYAAEELVRGTGDYDGYSAFVRYCPTNNYWLVSFSRTHSGGVYIVDTVIRAADGKIISTIETYGCT